MATEATEPTVVPSIIKPGEEYFGYKTGIPALDCAISCLKNGRKRTSDYPHFKEILDTTSKEQFGKFVERAIIHLITTDEKDNVDQSDFWLRTPLNKLGIVLGTKAKFPTSNTDPDRTTYESVLAISLAIRLGARHTGHTRRRHFNYATLVLDSTQMWLDSARPAGFTGELRGTLGKMSENLMVPIIRGSLRQPFTFAHNQFISSKAA